MKQSIRQLRLARGWSQEQLARKMGYDRRRVSKLENGLGATVEDQLALAAAFECQLEEIEFAPARPSGGRSVPEKELLAAFRARPPELPEPERNGTSRLASLRYSQPELMRIVTPMLDRNPSWQRFLDRGSSDSSEETGNHLWELIQGAKAVEVTTASLGFDLWPHVQKKTWRSMARCRMPALATKDWIWVPQVTVVTPRRWHLDGLVVVLEPQRTPIDLEVDGIVHELNWDSERERDLGMVTLRIPAGEVMRGPTLTQRLQAMGFCLPRRLRD